MHHRTYAREEGMCETDLGGGTGSSFDDWHKALPAFRAARS